MPTPEGAQLAYETLLAAIEHQGRWYWSRWHYFLLANSLLFVAAGQAYLRPGGEDISMVVVVAVAGVLLSLFWWITSVSTDAFHRMRIHQARELERYLGSGTYGAFSHGGTIRDRLLASGSYTFETGEEIRLFPHGPRVNCILRRITTSDVTAKYVPWLFVLTWLTVGCCAVVPEYGVVTLPITVVIAAAYRRRSLVSCLRCLADS